MKEKIIIRVDDRLIHGQVIEGWIKYFKIKNVIILDDVVSSDPLQKMIYSNILPSGCSINFISVKEFLRDFHLDKSKLTLVIVGSVSVLHEVISLISNEFYINIGCVASREHKIEITDTVFLDIDEIRMLNDIREKYDVHVKKLPWETSVEIKNFYHFLEDKI